MGVHYTELDDAEVEALTSETLATISAEDTADAFKTTLEKLSHYTQLANKTAFLVRPNYQPVEWGEFEKMPFDNVVYQYGNPNELNISRSRFSPGTGNDGWFQLGFSVVFRVSSTGPASSLKAQLRSNLPNYPKMTWYPSYSDHSTELSNHVYLNCVLSDNIYLTSDDYIEPWYRIYTPEYWETHIIDVDTEFYGFRVK